ncbi:MAG: hypothetical protein Q8942_17800 [Bacillota bacterium]|nr:hypothetical protein [Bacillota bacterium]
MYNMVKKSILFYKNIMFGTGYRDNLIDPFMLITDIKKYYVAKNESALSYRNLCDVVYKMRELYNTGEDKYHAFGNFLREVEDAGFDLDTIMPQNVTEDSKLEDQMELIRMLLCFKYCPVN